jgi:general stress protein CsbA
MAAEEGTGARRPNRNVIWLIGLAVVALLIGVLAANSRMSEGESAGHDFRSPPCANTASPG